MFMKSKFWIVEMPKYSIVLFCLLNIVAMYLYPGGSIHNKEQIGYVFTKNFFSDLGTTVSYSGAENMVSCILFNISLCICGFTFIMLFYKVRTLFKFKGISFFATLFGVLGGICFIGVAFTPANLLLDPHILFAHGIFRCLLIASILYSIMIFKTDGFDNKYAYGFISLGIAVFVYVMISEIGPDPRSHPGALVLQVVSQKAIALWLLLSIYLYSIGLGRYIYKKI